MKTTCYSSPSTSVQSLRMAIVCGSGGSSLLPDLDLSTDNHRSPRDSR